MAGCACRPPLSPLPSPHRPSLFLPASCQIDVGAHAAGLEQKTQQVQLQLQSLEQQIAVLKHQYAATPPTQRPILAQRLKMMMNQRAGLQRQAMSYQTNQMNLQQSACFRRRPLLPTPAALRPPHTHSPPRTHARARARCAWQWTLPGSRQR